MGVKDTNKCLECQETDFIEHAFFQCNRLQKFWLDVEQFILIETNTRLNIDEKVALFGVSKLEILDKEKRKRINLILLIARLSISKYKYGVIKNLEVIFDSELKIRKLKA